MRISILVILMIPLAVQASMQAPRNLDLKETLERAHAIFRAEYLGTVKTRSPSETTTFYELTMRAVIVSHTGPRLGVPPVGTRFRVLKHVEPNNPSPSWGGVYHDHYKHRVRPQLVAKTEYLWFVRVPIAGGGPPTKISRYNLAAGNAYEELKNLRRLRRHFRHVPRINRFTVSLALTRHLRATPLVGALPGITEAMLKELQSGGKNMTIGYTRGYVLASTFRHSRWKILVGRSRARSLLRSNQPFWQLAFFRNKQKYSYAGRVYAVVAMAKTGKIRALWQALPTKMHFGPSKNGLRLGFFTEHDTYRSGRPIDVRVVFLNTGSKNARARNASSPETWRYLLEGKRLRLVVSPRAKPQKGVVPHVGMSPGADWTKLQHLSARRFWIRSSSGKRYQRIPPGSYALRVEVADLKSAPGTIVVRR